MKPIDPNVTMAADVRGLAGLKRAAHDSKPSPETLKQVASQFEALFMHMMLKSMREASFGDDLFGSEQSNFYRDMYDQQLSMTLAKKQGMGLADVLVRQLGGDRLMTAVTGEHGKDSVALTPDRPFQTRSTSSIHGLVERLQARVPAENQTGNRAAADPTAFARALWPHAERAAKDLGVAPQAIVAVAALETGWGGTSMVRPDGRNANNLFGIKADDRWQGERVTASTHEFENGKAVTRRETFRAYDSIADSVDDFARFLKDNPRYREALAAGSDARAFVESLARSGYATDPAYARKAQSILAGDTLRTALADLKVSNSRPIPA
ncbi:MAG TPA: flagellar assembly peptidoglycan hydrolase FlgJ [Acidiferrobacterales bacterium]|nr:flagellar assembly peptidoglycan hydrolase FlgJ [Acidiferrobacterales bacterium]